ncbi:hypothetical protein TSUD_242780 [Trifolium subterraneum]|uniref:Uncharacterized protein n=1 Tax=Trifolium subterraneum TaxID=3900 RepID=A0A2Z6MXZ5_TRISU|nr:hypothetical protein TSUD_242780 [Trifolium subterraneum]
MLEFILRNKEISNHVLNDNLTKHVPGVSSDPIDVDKFVNNVVDNEVEMVDDTSSDASEFVNNAQLENFVDQEQALVVAPHDPVALPTHSPQPEPTLSQKRRLLAIAPPTQLLKPTLL